MHTCIDNYIYIQDNYVYMYTLCTFTVVFWIATDVIILIMQDL